MCPKLRFMGSNLKLFKVKTGRVVYHLKGHYNPYKICRFNFGTVPTHFLMAARIVQSLNI